MTPQEQAAIDFNKRLEAANMSADAPAESKEEVKAKLKATKPTVGNGRYTVWKDKTSQHALGVNNVYTLEDNMNEGVKYTFSMVVTTETKGKQAELANVQSAIAEFLSTIHEAL